MDQKTLEIIEAVLKKLAGKFRFGFYEIDDMRQEGFLFALKALPLWDKTRPLERFLFIHLRNRFINFKRDKFSRHDTPCLRCVFYDPKCLKSDNQCAVFHNKNNCKKYARWCHRNNAKKSLMRPQDISCLFDYSKESPTEKLVELRDLISFLDARIVKYRKLWQKAKEGKPLKFIEKKRLQREILVIIGDNNHGT